MKPDLWFLDASALVKRYLLEPGSDQVRQLMRQSSIATARLSEVEIASAVTRRCREGAFSISQRDRILKVVELTTEVSRRASNLLKHHVLRASDAVQLASGVTLVRELGVEVGFLAFDMRLIEAARSEGLIVEL